MSASSAMDMVSTLGAGIVEAALAAVAEIGRLTVALWRGQHRGELDLSFNSLSEIRSPARAVDEGARRLSLHREKPIGAKPMCRACAERPAFRESAPIEPRGGQYAR